MLEKDLTAIQLSVNNHTLIFTNSFYYNWFKTLQKNLMQSNNFTQYWTLLKAEQPEAYKKAEEGLLSAAIIAFLKQLDPKDTFFLLTVSWSYHLSVKQPEKTLQNFLLYYTIQKNDLQGINQMNLDLNQVLIQHFPLLRKQDLKMIYRLLELYPLSKTERQQNLSNLNQRAQEKTQTLLSLLEDAYYLAEGDLEVLNE